MAVSIGEAVIKLGFDDSSMQKTLKSLGTTAKIGGKFIAAGLAAATTAVVGLGTASIRAYGEFEQTVGGIETLFDKSADKMKEYASEAYKTAQMNATDYMNTAISFSASLVQSLGGDTAKAADYANRAIIDMSDNANKMGTDIGRLQDAYRGFARQQYNMLDNLSLGYGGTRSEMERLIKDAASYKEEQAELNVVVEEGNMGFANIVNAISVVQKHLKIAGTSAKEASTTIQGSFNSMKAAAGDLIRGLTDPNADLGKLMDNFIKSIVGDGERKGFLDNIEPAIERALTGIAELLEKGVPKIVEMLPDLLSKTLPGIAEAAVQVIVAITGILPTLAPVLADGLSVLVRELVPYLPQILGALVSGVALFWLNGWKSSFELWGQLIEQAIQALSEQMMVGVKVVRNVLSQVVSWIQQNIIAKIQGFFAGLWNGIRAGAQGLVNAFKSIFGVIGGVVKAPINAIIDAINRAISSINSIKIPDWVPGIGGAHANIGKIPRLAEGGVATKATGAMIGEAGKEAVIPLERNTDNWAGLLARTLADEFSEQSIAGTGLTIYMTNNINNNLDADEIGQRLMTSIRRAA